MSTDLETLDTCGCCEGVRDLTPAPLFNPPGLASLVYRAGTHASFTEAMKAALMRRDLLPDWPPDKKPPLGYLTTRAGDDPTIALIDAWATTLDVLTFYQERIANEGYLRTATETRSIRELARAIGYELGAGAAAATDLAFELETAPGAPEAVTLATGVKVQSLPGPGEQPQVFETVEELEARPVWNALRAGLTRTVTPAFGAREVFLAGVESNVRPGDVVLFVGNERLEIVGDERWDVRRVEVVEPDAERGFTHLAWSEGLGWQVEGKTIEPAQRNLKLYVLRQRAALFGHNAPDWRAMPDAVKLGYGVTPPGTQWPRFSLAGVRKTGEPADSVFLDALYPQIVAGSWVVLAIPTYLELYGVLEAVEDSRTDFTLSAKTTRLRLSGEQLAEIFGQSLRETIVFGQSEQLPLAEAPLTDPVQGDEIELAEPVRRLAGGRALVVSGKRARVAPRASGLNLVREGSPPVELSPGDVLEVLLPVTTNPGGTRTWKLRHESGAAGTVVADETAFVLAPAPAEAETVSERATTGTPLSDEELQETLKLRAPLQHAYDRESLRIKANVVAATHGETKQEILGGGDAASAFQSFTVKDAPLTYVPSPDAPSGGVTTLSIRVDGVLWKEARALYGLGPRERAYAVRIGDDGKATIVFGDGEESARLPTGVDNLRATYRVGTGLVGQVTAGQLTLLTSPPLGVKGVTNPFAAEGADDPETSERARGNAPLTVLTFERIVSLRDYEDFAAAFAGIGKAQATWLWDGETRVVHLTVAAADGSPPARDSVTLANLSRAVRKAGEPTQPVRIEPYGPLRFEVEGSVFVNADYEPNAVLAAVTLALQAAFSFERRAFGQSVAQSEVVAAIQRVEGVEAVDMLALNATGAAKAVNAILPSLRARRDETGILPAQLLTVDPEAITLASTA